MEISKEAAEIIAWAAQERAKHRTMTSAEYYAWTRAGDAISSPTQANPFPGGLTIVFSDGVLGSRKS